MEKIETYSSVDWLNHLTTENKKHYVEKTPDQVVIDFLKRRKEFPFLQAWIAFFLPSYFESMNPEMAPAFLALFRKTSNATALPREYLWTIAIATEAIYSAVTVLNVVRVRAEQFVKSTGKRKPGPLGDFFQAYKNEQTYLDLLKSVKTRKYTPQLPYFWNPQDVAALQAIRDGLKAGWKGSSFDYTEKDLSQWLDFFTVVRMQLVEFHARMIFSSGPQWIEILKIFLRRSLPFDHPDFKSVGKDFPVDKTISVKATGEVLKFADEFYNWPAPKLPEEWLNCGLRGLNRPLYSTLYKTAKQKRKKAS